MKPLFSRPTVDVPGRVADGIETIAEHVRKQALEDAEKQLKDWIASELQPKLIADLHAGFNAVRSYVIRQPSATGMNIDIKLIIPNQEKEPETDGN